MCWAVFVGLFSVSSLNHTGSRTADGQNPALPIIRNIQ